MATITDVNTVFMLGVTGLFTVPQQLQGYAADDISAIDPIDNAEVLMGADGVMSAGFVFIPIKQTIALQADSASNAIFEQWYSAQLQIQDLYFAFGILIYPGLKMQYTMTRGVLSSYPPAATAARVLQPRKYSMTWNSIIPAAII